MVLSPGKRSLDTTALWSDTKGIPNALSANLDQHDSIERTLSLIDRGVVRRLVVTGNGASYYAAQTMVVAASLSDHDGPEVIAVPAEWLASCQFKWRSHDRLIVVSTSGELKEAISAIDSTPQPSIAITGDSTSAVGSRADACIGLVVHSQGAFTHTQAFVGHVAILLSLWARLSGDYSLKAALESVSDRLGESIPRAHTWVENLGHDFRKTPSGIVGGPCGTEPAAYETALLLKELALLPVEAMNLREAATTGLYAAGVEHLCLLIPTGKDEDVDEAEELARDAGAISARLPGADEDDVRLSSITTLPYAIAFAATVGLQRGVNVDHPPWIDRYLAATRQNR